MTTEDTGNHVWMKYMRVPVDILPGFGEEEFSASIDDESMKKAHEQGVYGCEVCGEPLHVDTVNTPCTGVAEELDRMLQEARNQQR